MELTMQLLLQISFAVIGLSACISDTFDISQRLITLKHSKSLELLCERIDFDENLARAMDKRIDE